jgi:hypothetical protein
MALVRSKVEVSAGDRHGGKQVRFVDGFFVKPRPILWESLFQALKADHATCEALHFLRLFPRLTFFFSDDGRFSGRVEGFDESNHSPVEIVDPQRFWTALGSFIAFVTWMGVSDLHAENLAYSQGLEEGKSPFLVLYDVEFVLEKMLLPSQSFLFSEPNFPMCPGGLGRLESKMSVQEVGLVLAGYLESLMSLRGPVGAFLAELVFQKPYLQCPVRVSLKSTHAYANWLRTGFPATVQSFLPEEVSQLEQGDIPYFYRFPSSADLYYWRGEEPVKVVHQVDIDRLHTSPESLLDPTLLQKRVSFGAAQLASKLASEPFFRIAGETFELVSEEQWFFVSTVVGTFKIRKSK